METPKMVVFVVKRYAVREAEKWRYALRKAKIGRYAVYQGSVTLMYVVFILQLINSSNERPLFVPRDRPIFFRIGSKKVRIFSYWTIRCKCT